MPTASHRPWSRQNYPSAVRFHAAARSGRWQQYPASWAGGCAVRSQRFIRRRGRETYVYTVLLYRSSLYTGSTGTIVSRDGHLVETQSEKDKTGTSDPPGCTQHGKRPDSADLHPLTSRGRVSHLNPRSPRPRARRTRGPLKYRLGTKDSDMVWQSANMLQC